jgi:hypothetical protein
MEEMVQKKQAGVWLDVPNPVIHDTSTTRSG